MKNFLLLYSIIFICVATLVGCGMVHQGAIIQARDLINSRQYGSALEKLSFGEIYVDPTSDSKAEIVYLRATCYEGLERYSDATGALRYLIDKFPDTSYAYQAKDKLRKIEKQMDELIVEGKSTAADTTQRPVGISVSTVKLHSPKIPKVSTPEGIMASLEFQSERPLEDYKLVLVLGFQVNQGGVSRVQYFLYQGKTPRKAFEYGSGQFSMSPGQSGQIRFFMYTPQIQGPPSRSVGYQSYGQRSLFRLQGHKKVSICLYMCQDEKCRKRLKISNCIEELVKF